MTFAIERANSSPPLGSQCSLRGSGNSVWVGLRYPTFGPRSRFRLEQPFWHTPNEDSETVKGEVDTCTCSGRYCEGADLAGK